MDEISLEMLLFFLLFLDLRFFQALGLFCFKPLFALFGGNAEERIEQDGFEELFQKEKSVNDDGVDYNELDHKEGIVKLPRGICGVLCDEVVNEGDFARGRCKVVDQR